MPVDVHIIDELGRAAKLNSHGELVVGKADHSDPYNAERSTAGVTNIVALVTNKRFIMTYLLVASDKTNLETQVYVYETRTVDGDNTTSEKMILSGGVVRNDRIILAALDLQTLPSRFVNIETDTTATINITVMGYYEGYNGDDN